MRSRRFFLLVGAAVLAIVAGSSVVLWKAAPVTQAQGVELRCPSGTSLLPGWQAYDQSTSLFRQLACLDLNGRLVINADQVGISNATSYALPGGYSPPAAPQFTLRPMSPSSNNTIFGIDNTNDRNTSTSVALTVNSGSPSGTLLVENFPRVYPTAGFNTSYVLHVNTSITFTGSGTASMTVAWGSNHGASFPNTIYTTGTTRAQTEDTVNLPAGTDPFQVAVQASGTYSSGTIALTCNMFEVWITAQP